MPKMKSRAKLEPRTRVAGHDLVADVNGILQVRHCYAFLQHDVADVIDPDWQAVLEPEFAQVLRAFEFELAAGALLRA